MRYPPRVSWNLFFEIRARAGGEVPIEVRARAGRAIRDALKRTKNVGFVFLEPDEKTPSSGSMQLLMREGNFDDFVVLVEALQALARADPDFVVLVRDEFELETERDVLSVGDLRRPPDPTARRGGYRAELDTVDVKVHRADLSMDHRRVASAFLEAITAEKLVTWSGSREGVVSALVPLIESVERGRWVRIDRVIQVLEEEAAVEEIFGTDDQLDRLWRSTLNRFG